MQIVADARRYATRSWQHRWKGLALAWLVCVLGWAAVYTLPNTYDASARIFADGDQVLGATLRGLAIDSQPGAQVETLQRTLLSRPNLERVIARTDLDLRVNDATSRERLLTSLAKQIRIQPQARTLYTISYSDGDPTLARDVVQTVLNLFIESAAVNDRQQMANARTFVNQQIASYEVQLREAERRRAEFRTRYLEILPAADGLSRLEAARARLIGLEGQLTDLRKRRDLMQEQLAQTSAMLTAEAAAGGESRLAEAERQLRELRLRYTEQHPSVVAQRNVITELRDSREGSRPTGARPAGPRANPAYDNLRVALLDANATIASIERQISEAETEIARLDAIARTVPQVQADQQNLDRDYNVLLRQYEELLARRESLQIAGQARSSAERVRLEVIDPPTVPTIPSGPNRLLFASAVLVIGIGAGGGLALLLVLLDRAFYTVHDLRALGLPVLGAVSSTAPPRPQVLAAVVFAVGFSALLGAYAALLAGGPAIVARVPELLARVIA